MRKKEIYKPSPENMTNMLWVVLDPSELCPPSYFLITPEEYQKIENVQNSNTILKPQSKSKQQSQ